MPRKVVRVYLTPQQRRILEEICERLGMHESDVLRTAFMFFAEKLGLLKQKVLGISPAKED